MRGGDSASTRVGEEQGNAVGCLDGQGERRIARYDNVGLRVAAKGIFGDHDRSAMNLMDTNELRRAHVHGPRDVVPRRGIPSARSHGTERPAPRREDVRRHSGKGTADERRSGRRLHPIECLARLRKV